MPGGLDGACLLCSEHEPGHCHQRLVAEYLRSHYLEIEIVSDCIAPGEAKELDEFLILP
jgi:hypothetical protein